MILLAYSYPRGAQTVTGVIEIDATVSEQHVASAQVTEHQVERGAAIADHIRALPQRLTLEGVVSNSPIALPGTQTRGVTAAMQKQTASTPGGGAVQFAALTFDGPLDRVRDVYAELVDAVKAGALWTITTSLAQYDEYAATSLPVPRDPSTGDSLRFTMEFTELRFVDAVEVPGLPPRRRARRTQPDHRGERPAQEAPPDVRTATARLFDGAVDLVKQMTK